MNRGNWLDAQYSILGGILLWPELVPKVLSQTEPEDFSDGCRTVYDAIRQLAGENQPVDPVSVNHVLGNRYGDFLAQLMEITCTAANIDYHIRICREQARVAQARTIGQQLALAEDPQEIQALTEQLNARMADKPGLKILNMTQALQRFYTRQEEKAEYLSWPIPELNQRLYAKRGSFVIIGGSPSAGKTAWALQCAAHMGRNRKVGFFSLETDSDILTDRMVASVKELTMDQIKRHNIPREGWDALAAASAAITSLQLDLIPAAGMDVAQIRAVSAMKGYDVVYIDYLQLILGSGSTRAEEVAKISMGLHTMAQSMGVTVIALSQLKRKGDSDFPSMSDLRESGQIEQDADIVMILQLENENEPAGPRGLYIAKNKEGTCFKLKLDFDGRHQTFSRANRTGETVRELKKTAKNAQLARQSGQQLSMLPGETWVPFQEGVKA